MAWNTWIHIIGVTSALILGAVVLFAPKIGKLHRVMGLGYLGSMGAVNFSALTMYRQTGEAGPFHILAAISLFGLSLGYVEVLRKRKGWMERHGVFMSWSYVGLVAAGLSQVLSTYVLMDSVLGIMATSVGTSILGGVLIFTLVPRTVRNLSGRNRAQTRDQAASAAR
jgi:uncharacterized membrane protein